MKNIFDDETVAVQQLLNDKHTLLEGYVTEQLFFNQFLSQNETPFSNGWWMISYKNIKIFFIINEKLNEFEKELINAIPIPNQCWQVYLKGDQYTFVRKNEILTQQQFIDKFQLAKLRAPMTATKDTRNIERQYRSIQFFKENKIIKKIATERKFANNFLTVYFNGMINIDLFTKKNDQINIIEIKYKYESRDGHFGINKGQMEMFKFFTLIGFKVYHFILYNHTRNMDISIFGYLDLQSNKNWYHIRLKDENICGIGIAPEMTSVSGSFKQSYYKVSFNEVSKRKIPLVI